jgi:hypothetical protein
MAKGSNVAGDVFRRVASDMTAPPSSSRAASPELGAIQSRIDEIGVPQRTFRFSAVDRARMGDELMELLAVPGARPANTAGVPLVRENQRPMGVLADGAVGRNAARANRLKEMPRHVGTARDAVLGELESGLAARAEDAQAA